MAPCLTVPPGAARLWLTQPIVVVLPQVPRPGRLHCYCPIRQMVKLRRGAVRSLAGSQRAWRAERARSRSAARAQPQGWGSPVHAAGEGAGAERLQFPARAWALPEGLSGLSWAGPGPRCSGLWVTISGKGGVGALRGVRRQCWRASLPLVPSTLVPGCETSSQHSGPRGQAQASWAQPGMGLSCSHPAPDTGWGYTLLPCLYFPLVATSS